MPYIDDLKTLREQRGAAQNRLATVSGVTGPTVARAEKHHSCKKETLYNIVDGLNKLNRPGMEKVPYEVITEISRYGS